LLPALVATAVACVAASLALMLAAATAPAVAAHLAFAAGVMPLILGAMMHFVPVLTRSRTPAPALHALPFAALGAGLLAGMAFFLPAYFRVGIHAGAALALAVAVVMAVWIVRRARGALGAPHPCLYWYLAAVSYLALAMLAVLAMDVWPQQRAALRVFHLHLNTLGFIGLTALGTLAVLLPTAASRPDRLAAQRLRSDLWLAAGGVLLLAAGAAWLASAAYAGLVLLLFPVLRLGTAWAVQFWREVGAAHGAAPSLAIALLGLTALLFAATGHASRRLAGSDAIFAFVLAFLLPLVTGALSQLLPVWLKPGLQTPWHREARQMLGAFAALRALAFVAAGLAVALGVRSAAWLAALALAAFILQLLRLVARRRASP
jgi:hypothetical protein